MRRRLVGAEREIAMVVAWILAMCVWHVGPAVAQQRPLAAALSFAPERFKSVDSPRAEIATTVSSSVGTIGTKVGRMVIDRRAVEAPWWAPVASGLVPGTGQFAMGQQRSVAYLVAEAYLVVQAMAAQRDGNRDRTEYRSLASDVARRLFGPGRPIGTWDYYENLEKYVASGEFDRIPGGAVNPETDETTYNGASWLRARTTYWRNPDVAPPDTSAEYARAMAFYMSRAVRDEYRWSWRDAQLQQDVYKQTIASANRSYQRAVNLAGLIGANHLTSLIDAYVTVRVRRYGGVRVAGLQLDGVESRVRAIGDPASGRRELQSALRFVPADR